MHIAILTGGISSERIIALRSAENIESYIALAGYTSKTYDLPTDIDLFLREYSKYDIVFPVFHGRYGEDGVITGMCETIGIPVAFSPSVVHALCIDKFRTNAVVEKLGVLIPKSWMPGLPPPPKLLPTDTEEILATGLIIKPNMGGSSVATSKAITKSEFQTAIEKVEEMVKQLGDEEIKLLGSSTMKDRRFTSVTDIPLVQEFIPGREFTVGVVGSSRDPVVLPIIEIIPKGASLFDWEEKYESDGSNEVFSVIDQSLREELEVTARRIFSFLGCRGVARMDFRVDGEKVYFLEVNTIPGMTGGSLVPKMWKKYGKTEKEFIDLLISTAIE